MNESRTSTRALPAIATALSVVGAVLIGQAVGRVTENWLAGLVAGLAVGLTIGGVAAAVSNRMNRSR